MQQPRKKAAAKAQKAAEKAAAPARKSAAKAAPTWVRGRVRIVWNVCDPSGKEVQQFPTPRRPRRSRVPSR